MAPRSINRGTRSPSPQSACTGCKNAVNLPLKPFGAIAVKRRGCENSVEQRFARPGVQEEVMATLETRLRQELRDYATELRQLAYTVPDGVGEHALLQLSDRMRAAADQVVRKGA
jgi:hypothetical protein